MLKQLKYKNDVIPGYFIDQNGKIYDSNGVEQELKFYSRCDYYIFKKHKVHQMMAHSFLGYKKGFDVHHKNEIKTDNRLQNLSYLTRAEHNSLHKLGNKYHLGRKHSAETKEKMSAAKKGTFSGVRKSRKQVYCLDLDKIFAGVKIAAEELSLPHSNISKCCQGKRKTCGGYHFEFYTGEQK